MRFRLADKLMLDDLAGRIQEIRGIGSPFDVNHS